MWVLRRADCCSCTLIYTGRNITLVQSTTTRILTVKFCVTFVFKSFFQNLMLLKILFPCRLDGYRLTLAIMKTAAEMARRCTADGDMVDWRAGPSVGHLCIWHSTRQDRLGQAGCARAPRLRPWWLTGKACVLPAWQQLLHAQPRRDRRRVFTKSSVVRQVVLKKQQ